MKIRALAFVLIGMMIVVIAGGQAETVNAQDCPTGNFLNVSQGSAGAAYPTPAINVYCSGDSLIVESNGIINYEFVQITPSDLQAQNYSWQIPLYPQMASSTSDIPLLGPIGIAVNGIPIYGPNEAARDGYGDPFLDQILDYCNGHTAQRGDYHYHARPDCLFQDMNGNVSLVIGYAFDGYPILAPYACTDASCSSVIKVQSSWQRTQNVTNAWEAHQYIEGSGDLDECNGMVGPDGSYRYYATDTFPYFLGCYRGIANTSNSFPGGGQGQGQPTDNTTGNQGQGTPPTGGQTGGQGNGQAQAPNGGQPPNGGQGPNGAQPANGGQPPNGGRPGGPGNGGRGSGGRGA